MNEIEKMYENAGVTSKRCSECDNNMDCGFGKGCYPPFTAEKQINILKILLSFVCLLNFKRLQFSENFANDLAGMVNESWHFLTEEDKQQIREILE